MTLTKRLSAFLLGSIMVLGLSGCWHHHHHDNQPPPPPPGQHP